MRVRVHACVRLARCVSLAKKKVSLAEGIYVYKYIHLVPRTTYHVLSCTKYTRNEVQVQGKRIYGILNLVQVYEVVSTCTWY